MNGSFLSFAALAGSLSLSSSGGADTVPFGVVQRARPASGGASFSSAEFDIQAQPIPQMEEVLRVFSEYMNQSGRDVSIERDSSTNRYIVSVYDGSGNLLRQVPSDELIALVRRMRSEGVAGLLNQRA